MCRLSRNLPDRVAVFLAVACLVGAGALRGAEEPKTPSGQTNSTSAIDFAKEIRPIIEKRCYECHGPQKQKSGLRLDRKSTALKGGDSGKPALVAGKSAESLLFQKVTSQDADEVMPPKGERLTSEQIALL